jgi:predicted ATPase/DNA-binding NarL/FixJ family response regulator
MRRHAPAGPLPIQPGRFIGRRSEVRRLVKLQSSSRLLTLVGPGGIGKTYLGIRVAGKRANAIAGGVWFLDLADSDRRNEQLGHTRTELWFTSQPVLLVLDTCDADIHFSAYLAQRLLESHENLQILATSRQPLGLTAETVWRVAPLSVPAEQDTALHELSVAEACQLLIDRMAAAFPRLRTTSDSSLAIARICRRLNGLPLAVEIAARHAAVLGPTALADRTITQLDLDDSSFRGSPARQRSLRATLDWSYARLTTLEQRVLRGVSIFAGNWSLEMAHGICRDLSFLQVADVVRSLVDKSLVQLENTPDEHKFALFDVTRQYCREMLRNCGELAGVRGAHLSWCVDEAESEHPETLNPVHADLLEQLLPELRLALDGAVTSGSTELGLRLATAMFPLWYLRGQIVEGLHWLDQLLAQPLEYVSIDVVELARAWRSQLLMQRGDYAIAESQLEKLLASRRARSESDNGGVGLVLLLLGNVALWRGDLAKAAALFEQAEAMLRRSGGPGVPMAVYQLARAAYEAGDYPQARSAIDRLMRLAKSRRAGMIARARQINALLAVANGETSRARRSLDEAERILRRTDDSTGFIDLLIDVGRVCLQTRQFAAAHQAYVNAAALARKIGARMRMIRATEGVACVLMGSRPGLCIQLAAAAAASRAAMGTNSWPRDARQLQEALAMVPRSAAKWPDAISTRTGSATFVQVWEMGTAMLESEAAEAAITTIDAKPPLAIADIPANLTGREWEVARLLAAGSSARQIAEQLTLSPDTVRTHLDHAATKLGLHSRVQLATWVARSQAGRH